MLRTQGKSGQLLVGLYISRRCLVLHTAPTAPACVQGLTGWADGPDDDVVGDQAHEVVGVQSHVVGFRSGQSAYGKEAGPTPRQRDSGSTSLSLIAWVGDTALVLVEGIAKGVLGCRVAQCGLLVDGGC